MGRGRTTTREHRHLGIAASATQLAALSCAIAAIRVDGPPGWLVVAAVALVIAGGGLRRGSIVGVVAAAVVLVAVVARTSGAHWCEVVAGVALVTVVVASRDASVWPVGERLAQAGRWALGSLVVLITLGTFGARYAGTGRPSLGSALHAALDRMIARSGDWSHGSGVTGAFQRSLPGLTAAAVLAALAILLTWAPDLPEPDADVRRRVDAMCVAADGDSLAPFTRRRDKSYVFSTDGRAVVGYRVVMGVCIAGPGPVGAAESHASALEAFVRRCDERGWRPAMIGGSDHARALAASTGMGGIRIGDDASVEVASYELHQPSMRNVRQAVQRTRNSGVEVLVRREGELEPALHDELVEVVEAWRRGRGELGFAMTLDGLLDGTYPEALLLVARHQGRVVGFQRYLVCRGGRTLSLDVMPRRRDAPNGVNERLIDEAVTWGRQHGVTELSLNFAAFRNWFEAEPSFGVDAMRRVVHALDPFINVESLYRFNAKFRPGWDARHVLYRSAVDVPFLLVAALRVEFGRRQMRSLSSVASTWMGTDTTTVCGR